MFHFWSGPVRIFIGMVIFPFFEFRNEPFIFFNFRNFGPVGRPCTWDWYDWDAWIRVWSDMTHIIWVISDLRHWYWLVSNGFEIKKWIRNKNMRSFDRQIFGKHIDFTNYSILRIICSICSILPIDFTNFSFVKFSAVKFSAVKFSAVKFSASSPNLSFQPGNTGA